MHDDLHCLSVDACLLPQGVNNLISLSLSVCPCLSLISAIVSSLLILGMTKHTHLLGMAGVDRGVQCSQEAMIECEDGLCAVFILFVPIIIYHHRKRARLPWRRQWKEAKRIQPPFLRFSCLLTSIQSYSLSFSLYLSLSLSFSLSLDLTLFLFTLSLSLSLALTLSLLLSFLFFSLS